MKRTVLFVLMLFLTLLTISNCGFRKATAPKSNSIADLTPLQAYGLKIYERESCGTCHTTLISESTDERLSLDGFGGKYPDSWLYHYFLDPKSVRPQSEKAPYKHLYVTGMDKNILSTLSIENETDEAWRNLMNDADRIVNVINSQGLYISESEVIPLIAYLQEIPASKMRKELDSIAHAELMEKGKIWDNINFDSNNIILEAARDNSNIESGQLLYNTNCSVCHGNNGSGGVGPNLTDEYWLHGNSSNEIARIIANGNPSRGMISWKHQLSPTEVGKIVTYINSLQGTNPANGKGPQGEKY